MIHENIKGAALKLRELAWGVTQEQWETIRSVCRVLDQAAEDAKRLERETSLCTIIIGVPAGAGREVVREQ